MRLLGETFPVLVNVAPRRYDAAVVKGWADAFEQYFQRGKRYAVISVQPEGSITPGAAERKLMLEWLESPRVRHYAGELCVGAATIVHGRVMRGALTAVLWFWKPPFPMETVATLAEGVDYCVERLHASGVPVSAKPAELKQQIDAMVAAALAEEL